MEIPTQGTTYYTNRENLSSTSMKEVHIRNQAVNTNINVNLMAVVYDVGATITFTICDAFIYEGAFCNPPNDKLSLDVIRPLSQFMLVDRSNVPSSNNYAISSYRGTIATHPVASETYENIFSLNLSESTAAAFFLYSKVKILAYSYSGFMYTMSVATFDLSIMQYTTYGSPDAQIFNLNIQDINHPNMSAASKVYVRIHDLKIVRDSSNSRILYLQGKISEGTNAAGRNGSCRLDILYENFGQGVVTQSPKLFLSDSTAYNGTRGIAA